MKSKNPVGYSEVIGNKESLLEGNMSFLLEFQDCHTVTTQTLQYENETIESVFVGGYGYLVNTVSM